MIGWFRPASPLDPAAKAWVEQRLAWLRQQFGPVVLGDRPVVLPTRDFFPDPFDGSKRSMRSMLNRVCGYMDVNPKSVSMKLFAERRTVWLVNEHGKYLPTGYAGLYEEGSEKFIIRLEASQLDNPMDLVGTMAHELAHVRLLGERRLDADAYDGELLTDLTVVFHGLGIFVANSPRNWDSQYSQWPGTTMKMPEYMTLPMYAYALAHVAWFRNEPWPVWAKFLRPDARAAFKQALRFLQKTGDSAFRP